MPQDYNRNTLSYFDNNSAGISLSHWEYHDLIDQLLDDRLSAEGLMKFKRLHSAMATNAIMIPIVTFPLAYVANKWLTGTSSVSQGGLTVVWHLRGTTL